MKIAIENCQLRDIMPLKWKVILEQLGWTGKLSNTTKPLATEKELGIELVKDGNSGI